MKCKELARAFSEKFRLPHRGHGDAKTCIPRQELVHLLDSPVPVDPPSPAILRQIEEAMATNLRPVRPLAPARYFLGAFVGISVSIVALGVYRLGAFAIPVMSLLQIAAILTTLAISTGFLASSAASQMVPGSRVGVSPKALFIGITISLTMATALLFQFQQQHDFWRSAWVCVRAATPIGGSADVLLWLVLRRGAVLSPSITGATTGLLGGLVGTAVLELHCTILNGWHILLSHFGVAILCALGGFVTGLIAETIGRTFGSSQIMKSFTFEGETKGEIG
jgi:hypothetical protein